MADITIDSDVADIMNHVVQPRSLVWTDKDTGYVFFIDSSADLHYRKTTDAGASWGTEVNIRTGTMVRLAIWYDKWTNGDTGTLIHIVHVDLVTGDNITYNSLDTSDDSLSGEVIVFDGASAFSNFWPNGCISITKARGGNIYVGGWIDPSGERGFWRSTDGGTSFGARADVTDGDPVDRIMLLPGNETDNQDIWCFYQDVSANEITLKVHDDSANAWSESAAIDTIAEDSEFFEFDVMERFSDTHAILVMWNEHASSTGDLAVWDITNSTTFTAKTDVVSNSAVYGICGLMINQINDDLYVAYTNGTVTGAVVYKLSTDGGGSWGDETAMSATSDDHRIIIGGTSVASDSTGRWMPVWFNDDLNDLLTNSDNSLLIAEAGGAIFSYSDAFVNMSMPATI